MLCSNVSLKGSCVRILFLAEVTIKDFLGRVLSEMHFQGPFPLESNTTDLTGETFLCKVNSLNKKEQMHKTKARERERENGYPIISDLKLVA